MQPVQLSLLPDPDPAPPPHAAAAPVPPPQLQAALAHLAVRAGHLRPEQAHIALQIPQRDPFDGQCLPFQPPQMVHQQVRVRPLGTRPVVGTQERIGRLVHRTLRPDDRERPPPARPRQLLDPQIPDNQPPWHVPSPGAPTWRTPLILQVRRSRTCPPGGSPDVPCARKGGG